MGNPEDRFSRDEVQLLFTSLVYLLQNASMAIGAFAVTAEREEKITFSYTIISSSVSMLLKRPPDTRNFFQFLLPFSTGLWVMIVAFFLALGLCLYLMSRFDSTQTTSEQKFDLKESMWYSLNVLLQGIYMSIL